jgi:arabinogalactan endo-1,4-beta-galactosidase
LCCEITNTKNLMRAQENLHHRKLGRKKPEPRRGAFNSFRAFHLLTSLTVSGLCFFASASQGAPFAKGADVGWLPQMEASGYKFYDRNGKPEDCLKILKSYGIDTIRLRVWVNPSQDPRGGHCSRDEVAAMAERAHKSHFRVMIDFHYSDSWADPGKQRKPAAWANHDVGQLKKDVYEHTTDVLNALKARGVTPEWVQIGNEIRDGMLWPDGRASTNGQNLAGLINAGYEAAKAVDPRIKVIVHLDDGNNSGLYHWFFDILEKNGAHYDVIGMSYYPYWQKQKKDYTQTMDDLGANLIDVAARYHKEVMVVEVGGEDSKAENTRDMIAAVIKKTRAVPGNQGLGVIYWEPEGAASWSGYKLSCWGADGRPTAALDGFLEKPTRPTAH